MLREDWADLRVLWEFARDSTQLSLDRLYAGGVSATDQAAFWKHVAYINTLIGFVTYEKDGRGRVDVISINEHIVASLDRQKDEIEDLEKLVPSMGNTLTDEQVGLLIDSITDAKRGLLRATADYRSLLNAFPEARTNADGDL
jgi:hypothetical protein